MATKFGDQLNHRKNLEYMEQTLLLIGIHVLVTACALTFAQFHYMIGPTRLVIHFLSGNRILHARKTAYNA
jgi:hypothetical protein